jgi:hypothetical protein
MNSKLEDSGKLPLHDEALAREKWRGKETLLKGDDDDLGLPASETGRARSASQGDEGEEGRLGRGRPGDFPPPD